MFKYIHQKNAIKIVAGKSNGKLENIELNIWFNSIELPLSPLHLHMVLVKSCNYDDYRPLRIQRKEQKVLTPCVWLFYFPCAAQHLFTVQLFSEKI